MISSIVLMILYLLTFLVLSIGIFYLTGQLVIIKKFKSVSSFEDLFLSLCLGIVIFISLTVIYGLTKLRFLTLPTLIVLSLFSITKGSLAKIVSDFKEIFKIKTLVFLLILGIIVQVLINFPSGLKYKEGIYFWSSQGHDGLWHVALIKEVARHFPLNNPLYAGKMLQNYHYSSDLLMGEFYRIFPFFDALDLYFRYFPVIFAFLIGLGVFSFAQRLWDKKSALWAVFFTYFCGSFGYIYSVIRGGFLFTGEATFWAAQGNTVLGNPPHALGIILITACSLSLLLWTNLKDKLWLLVLVLLGFFLTTVKVSSGAILLISLGIASLFSFLKEKKIELLLTTLFLGITNFICLKLISPNAESFLIFLPLWFPRTMMVAKLNMVDWELRRQHYIWKNTWHSWLRVIQLEVQAILLFIIGNSGIRILGYSKILKSFREIKVIDVFLFSTIIFPVVFVLLFIQKGIVFNLIQFMQIYLHFLGIFSGATVAFLLRKKMSMLFKAIIVVIVISLAVPTVIGNLFDFYGPKTAPNSKVSYSELSALTWLKENSKPTDIILTKPFMGMAEYRYTTKPWPISAWYSTPYVFVFSERYAYLSGEEQLMITGYKTEEDLKLMKQFFDQTDYKANENFLVQKNISYIYVRKDELKAPLDEKLNNIKQVFANDEVLIYKTGV